MTEAKWRKNFSKKLINMLVERNITQKDLAIKSKLSEPAISRYCSGDQTPSCYSILKIAAVLDCTTDELVDV